MCGVPVADFFGLICAAVWGLYEDHSSSAVGHECEMSQAYLFVTYANTMKCMYICVPD